jgi:hypothetical protein
VARLYLIAVDHDAVLAPTFAKMPFPVPVAAMETMILEDAFEMDPGELRRIIGDLERVLLRQRPDPVPLHRARDNPPPVPDKLPFDQQEDPDDWRRSMG